MHNKVEIALHGIAQSGALERYIDLEARRLNGIIDGVRSCQVVAEALKRQKLRGAQFAVRLIITLPGTEVVVNREHSDDIYVALHEAFAAAGLQLKDRLRRRISRDRPGD